METNKHEDKATEFKILGDIEKAEQDGNTFRITCAPEKVRVVFLRPDIVRIWMDPEGEFKDPTNGDILTKTEFDIPEISVSDKGDYYKIQSSKCVIRAYKNPLKFAMYDHRDKTAIWEEETPIMYSSKCAKQTLKTGEDEYFYGGGVQNGYFSHKNKTIHIEDVNSHWNDGSVSNPAPFYMSTAGYGAFRNTFKPGEYKFTKTATMSHNENRFDCFYFYGSSLKAILSGYISITGRPSLIPRWGFGLGDADCYNTSNTTYTGTHNKPNKGTTLEALKVAKAYRDEDMPGSWILPNDGYGCGYTDVDKFVKEAWDEYGFRVGLWTQNGVEKIAHEVGDLGTRLCKLDVAWVGPGYEFALNGAKTAYEGIEKNTVRTDENGTYNERGYVWSVCGWAGTQRYSTVWSGDQSGNWEYIRFHIPTYIGAGLSGMPYIGSDIDGIFGGSAKTQVRDLQWKCFTPIIINMSGWAEKDKQPWIWGEPYTSINRKYLKLRQQLIPYIYTYADEAYETGAPIVRAMVWEFPKDTYTMGRETRYQFMLGNWFLVAPVFEDSEVRDRIYLPQGKWIDYWTGKQYKGGKVINGYNAPLDVLPLLVRAGAIIPMYPESLYDGEVFPDDKHPLTLDIYPSGKTSFTLYEDDGHTTLHRQGKFAKTLITSEEFDGKAAITVEASQGKYDGMPFTRKYELLIHTTVDPKNVTLTSGEAVGKLNRLDSKEEWDLCECCSWYFAPDEKGGVLYIKTKALPLSNEFKIELDKFSKEVNVQVPEGLKAPQAPRNLRVTDIQDSSIQVEWDAIEGAEYYDVKADGIIYSFLHDKLVHQDLEFTSKHNYQVRAVNEAGESAWSKEIFGTTKEDKMKNAVPPEELSAYATSSLREMYASQMAVDGDPNSAWISNYNVEKLPQTITVDMAKIYDVDRIVYIPRGEGEKAVITKFNFYASEDGRNFKELISGGTWKDDGEPKTIAISSQRIKSIRIEALETSKPEFSGASVKQINIFRTPGTKGMVASDYTGDGKVDSTDLNFVLQYYRIKQGDNDWSYVSKADVNKDGVIGIYDVAYTASLIEKPQKAGYVNRAKGVLKLRPSVSDVKVGQEFSVDVIGENVADLYAFESIIAIDKGKYELAGFENGAVKGMTSACKEKDGKAYIAYTNTANAEGVYGSGVLARLKLISKADGKVCLMEESATIIGTNLDVVDALSTEASQLTESVFEFKISLSEMAASATAEDAGPDDNTASKVIDGDDKTFWITPFDKSALLPQSLIIDLGGVYEVTRVRCMPCGSGAYGVITSYSMYILDNENNETKISEGKWIDDGKEKEFVFAKPSKAAKIKIEAKEGNGGLASMVGIKVFAASRE